MENLLAMKELERGREFANQLQGLIFGSGDQEDKALTTKSTEDLAAKVLNSFTNALSLFNNHHHVPADSSPSSFFYLPANSDVSHQSPKSSKTRSPSSIKDQRSCSSKKRKVMQTWEEDSKMSPKEDGHAWRKYGQKIILNSKHPRNYFRCTHKYEQGCKATKQVQQIQDDPPLYRTTYFGHHTCTNLLNPQILLDDSHDDLNSTSACILRFDNNRSITTTFDQKVKTQQQNQLFLSPGFSLFPSSAGSVKNEDHHCHNIKQDKNINYINDYIDVVVPPSCSSNDCLVSPDEEEAVDLPFGYGDDQVVDVFNSLVLEDPLFDMIFDH